MLFLGRGRGGDCADGEQGMCEWTRAGVGETENGILERNGYVGRTVVFGIQGRRSGKLSVLAGMRGLMGAWSGR